MRRLLAVCVLALCGIATIAAPAQATHNTGTGPGYDFVDGTGNLFASLPPFGPFDIRLHVNGRTAANGQNPRGRFWTSLDSTLVDLTVELSGTLTCLRVENHSVSLSGVIERSSLGFPAVGSGIFAFGVDNGEGANSSGDGVLGVPIGTPMHNCPQPVSDGVLIRQGNFVAHDAQFVP